ncbi:MAG: M6 family metalloprotease domain-containing protein [Verrucomicrobia bacterium]|nr:M6 family metalloprotease domain-containing protein [Verrucomicrobiota bacterium]
MNAPRYFPVWPGLWLAASLLAQPLIGAASDLEGFKTVATAITTQIVGTNSVKMGRSGYLGVAIGADAKGRLIVSDVEPDSPAANAGVRPGDVLAKLGGRPVPNAAVFRETLQARAPGDEVKLTVQRKGRSLELAATLAAVSRPIQLSERRAVLGVRVEESKDADGMVIRSILSGSIASKSGLRPGDVLQKADGVPLTGVSPLSDALMDRQPGDYVTLAVRRNGREFELRVRLAAPKAETQSRPYWDKDCYRLAVIPLEFPDTKRNPQITAKDWNEVLFSRGTHTGKTNATGQAVFGSLNDYYQEQSCGALRVEGKLFDWVQVGKKRADYAPGLTESTKAVLLTETIDALMARNGTNALANSDGLLFLYAGERVPQASRGSLYWPHRGYVTHRGKRWSYVICPEGGPRMTNVSLLGHEFGHMLGLPDLYARPENPGSEGLGLWCAMSNQVGLGRPQHFCPWCKERLGWLKPALIDPTVKQKLILAPVEGSTIECLKVLIRRDGTEYLLLENRRKKGFDQSLPGEGLLIWHVVRNKPILEESHGVEGPPGPFVFLHAVPFPSKANTAFTPYTTPSSRSLLGGGLPVFITNIRRLDDDRIAFHIGYEYQ